VLHRCSQPARIVVALIVVRVPVKQQGAVRHRGAVLRHSTSWGNVEYTAKGDYRQAAFDHSAGDLAAGEKTLALLCLEDARFGGIVHIPYCDEGPTATRAAPVRATGSWSWRSSSPSGRGFLKGDRAGPGDLRQMTTTTPVRVS